MRRKACEKKLLKTKKLFRESSAHLKMHIAYCQKLQLLFLPTKCQSKKCISTLLRKKTFQTMKVSYLFLTNEKVPRIDKNAFDNWCTGCAEKIITNTVQ